MKQQRNFVHYKRNKKAIERSELAAQKLKKEVNFGQTVSPKDAVKGDALVLVIRIKGYNSATSP